MLAEDERKSISLVEQMLKRYDKDLCSGDARSPEEFIKNQYCESNLFLSQVKEESATIFFEICSMRKLLESIAKYDLLPANSTGLVHIYLILFYMSSSNQEIILESLMDSFRSKDQDKIVDFFSKPDLFDIVAQMGCFFYQTSRVFEQVLKDISERLPTIHQSADMLTRLRQKKRLNSINYTIEHVDELIQKYSKLPSENLSSARSNSLYSIPESMMRLKTRRITQRDNVSLPQIPSKEASVFEREQSNDLERNSFKPSSTIMYRPRTCPIIKKTTAQVLRDGAQINKKAKKAEQALKDLCNGSTDPFLTKKLMDEAYEQDRILEMQNIERKHLLGLISREEARIGKLAVHKCNQIKANELKIQSVQLEMKLSEWRRAEEARIRDIAERNQLQLGQAKLAQTNLLNQKKENARIVQHESREFQKRIEEQRKNELDQKVFLIRQIKELEQLAKANKYKDNNMFGESKISLLTIGPSGAMSIHQLKTSLAKIKEEIKIQVEKRREKIKAERLRHQKLVEDALAIVENNKDTIKMPVKSKWSQNLTLTPDLINLRKKLERRKQEVANMQ